VTVHYATEAQTDYLDAALKTVFQIHTKYPPGAILVFLPGESTKSPLIFSYVSHPYHYEKGKGKY